MNLFPHLPRQAGCNKRLRAAASLITTLIRMLAVDTSAWADDTWVFDSNGARPAEATGPAGKGTSRL